MSTQENRGNIYWKKKTCQLIAYNIVVMYVTDQLSLIRYTSVIHEYTYVHTCAQTPTHTHTHHVLVPIGIHHRPLSLYDYIMLPCIYRLLLRCLRQRNIAWIDDARQTWFLGIKSNTGIVQIRHHGGFWRTGTNIFKLGKLIK